MRCSAAVSGSVSGRLDAALPGRAARTSSAVATSCSVNGSGRNWAACSTTYPVTCGAVVTTVLRKPWLRAACSRPPITPAAAGSPRSAAAGGGQMAGQRGRGAWVAERQAQQRLLLVGPRQQGRASARHDLAGGLD